MEEKKEREGNIPRLSEEERALLVGFYKGYTNLDFSTYTGDKDNLLKDLVDTIKVSLFWARRLRASVSPQDRAVIQGVIDYINTYLKDEKVSTTTDIPDLFEQLNTLAELLVKYDLDELIEREIPIAR